MPPAPPDLTSLLRDAAGCGASDIHLKVPSRPLVRVHGRVRPLGDRPPLRPADTEALLAEMMAGLSHSTKQVEFERRGEADFAYAEPGLGRFRVSAFRQRGSVSIVLRVVPFGVPRLDTLGLPHVVQELAERDGGLVLVSGRIGSGRTTTLAAMVDHVNRTATRTIVTVEDPIEVLHADALSIVNQREVGLDTPSFADALASLPRHDPDVVLVGDVRDAETAEAALAIAETGVLVLAGTSSRDAPEAVARIAALFPVHRQGQIRESLAVTLRGVICQRMLTPRDGAARRPAVEILVGTPAVEAAIAESEPVARLHAIMESGEAGMCTFAQSVAAVAAAGDVDADRAGAGLRRVRGI